MLLLSPLLLLLINGDETEKMDRCVAWRRGLPYFCECTTRSFFHGQPFYRCNRRKGLDWASLVALATCFCKVCLTILLTLRSPRCDIVPLLALAHESAPATLVLCDPSLPRECTPRFLSFPHTKRFAIILSFVPGVFAPFLRHCRWGETDAGKREECGSFASRPSELRPRFCRWGSFALEKRERKGWTHAIPSIIGFGRNVAQSRAKHSAEGDELLKPKSAQ